MKTQSTVLTFLLLLGFVFVPLLAAEEAAPPAAENSALSADAIAPGKTVKMHFTTKSGDKVLEDTRKGEPFEFVMGSKQMIPGIETAIAGMKAGDKKTLDVKSGEAFGPHNPQAIVEVPREQFKDQKVEAGMVFQGQNDKGQPLMGLVKEVKDNTIVIDFNHPLAGQDLQFEIEILEVK